MQLNRFGFKRALCASTALLAPMAAVAQETDEDVEEIVIRGQFIPDEKRTTSEVANVLDAEALALSGDSNIAESLKRVTGLSLVDGKFVVVRGLNERYTQTLLNGAELPGVEPLQRIVALDIFPNALINNALIQKTYSPQYGADFAGAVIDLRSKSTPDEAFFEFGISASGNTASTLQDGLTPANGDFDFLGADFGFRERPEFPQISLDGVREEPPFATPLAGLTPLELEIAGESIPNNYSLFNETNPVNYGVDFSTGKTFDAPGGMRFGVLLAGGISDSTVNKFGERRVFQEGSILTPDGDVITGVQVADTDFSPTAFSCVDAGLDGCGFFNTERFVETNALLSLGLEINPDHKIEINSLLLRQTQIEGLIEQGFPGGASDDALVQNVRSDYIERMTWVNQLRGEHYFDFGLIPQLLGTTLNWQVTYSETDRDVEGRRDFQFEFGTAGFELSSDAGDTNVRYNELEDGNFEGGASIVQDFDILGRVGDIKIGGNYKNYQRESFVQEFTFLNVGSAPDLTLAPELIFSPINIRPGGIVLSDATTDFSDFFNADLEEFSFFGQVDVELLDPGSRFGQLRLAAGLRYEDHETIVTFFSNGGTVVSEEINLDPDQVELLTGTEAGDAFATTVDDERLLPAITLTWEFQPNMQVRFGYSATVNRPTFRELSVSPFLDPDRDIFVSGNPNLDVSELDNLDARFEWFFARDQFMAFSLFWKNIDRPIEQFRAISADEQVIFFGNAERSRLFGGEFEIELKGRTALEMVGLHDMADGLGTLEPFFNFNVTYIDSDTTVANVVNGEVDNSTVPGNPTSQTRTLINTSPVLANFQIGLEDVESLWRTALIFNYTGDRIDTAGIEGANDFVEDLPVLLDFVASKEYFAFGGVWEIGFEARNLLGQDQRLLQGTNFLTGADNVAEQFDVGRTFELGLTVRY